MFLLFCSSANNFFLIYSTRERKNDWETGLRVNEYELIALVQTKKLQQKQENY